MSNLNCQSPISRHMDRYTSYPRIHGIANLVFRNVRLRTLHLMLIFWKTSNDFHGMFLNFIRINHLFNRSVLIFLCRIKTLIRRKMPFIIFCQWRIIVSSNYSLCYRVPSRNAPSHALKTRLTHSRSTRAKCTLVRSRSRTTILRRVRSYAELVYFSIACDARHTRRSILVQYKYVFFF